MKSVSCEFWCAISMEIAQQFSLTNVTKAFTVFCSCFFCTEGDSQIAFFYNNAKKLFQHVDGW